MGQVERAAVAGHEKVSVLCGGGTVRVDGAQLMEGYRAGKARYAQRAGDGNAVRQLAACSRDRVEKVSRDCLVEKAAGQAQGAEEGGVALSPAERAGPRAGRGGEPRGVAEGGVGAEAGGPARKHFVARRCRHQTHFKPSSMYTIVAFPLDRVAHAHNKTLHV